MNDIANFKQYKKAKKVVEELDNALKIISLAIKGLSLYDKYIPVQDAIYVLQCNKTILNIHRKKYKKIVDNKGVV